jgi:hypothetical protein
MTIFISYSLGIYEQYILNLLSKKLAERGHSLITNSYAGFDSQIQQQIQSAGLFLGLITLSGQQSKSAWVAHELSIAEGLGKPCLMLVQEGTPIQLSQKVLPNTIIFNPNNVDAAIQMVQEKSDQAQAQRTNTNAAWLLGGIAAIALLAYLSEEKK